MIGKRQKISLIGFHLFLFIIIIATIAIMKMTFDYRSYFWIATITYIAGLICTGICFRLEKAPSENGAVIIQSGFKNSSKDQEMEDYKIDIA